MARKSVNFNVSPEVYEKVREVFPDVIGTEDNLLLLIEAYKKQQEHRDDVTTDNSEVIANLEEKNTQLQQEIDQLKEEKENFESRLSELQTEKDNRINELESELESAREQQSNVDENEYNRLVDDNERLQKRVAQLESAGAELPTWDRFRATLSPFPVNLLEKTAARLSVYYKRDITPEEILLDMFLRYTIERNAEWFYPFVLKDADIVAAAQEIDGRFENIRQIRKAFNLD